MTPRIITADEVQVGDTIRVEVDWLGVRSVHELTVGAIKGGEVWAKGGGHVLLAAEDRITLLDRPAPPLPTEPGSLIEAWHKDGRHCPVATLGSYGDWLGADDSGEWRAFRPEHIVRWRPVTVTPEGEVRDV